MNAQVKDNTVTIKDSRLIFKNFRGKGDKYNREGDRNFCIVLNKTEADELALAGWNVKTRPPREGFEDAGELYYLKVNLKFETRGRPPRVVAVNSKTKTRLDADSVGSLDWARIETADIRIRPYEYEPGKFSAYLVTLFAVVEEDELEDRYADIPERGEARPIEEPRREENFDDDDRPF